MKSEKELAKMKGASPLLPPPGGAVVRELIDSHTEATKAHADLIKKLRELKTYAPCETVDGITMLPDDVGFWVNVGELDALLGDD